MARKTRKQVEEDKVRFVVNFCAKCWKETGSIRTKWEDNFIQFDKGSSHELKDEWQSKLSLKKLETRVRGAAGQCRGQLINNPDWFDLDPVNPQNSELSSLAPTFKKLVRYYLDAGKFSQRASTFLLLAYLSMGSMMVGWTRRKLKNPAYVEWKFKQQLKSKGSEDFSDSTNSR